MERFLRFSIKLIIERFLNLKDYKIMIIKVFLTTIILSFSSPTIMAQKHLKFMGIPIDGKRDAMIVKMKEVGFTIQTQQNEVGTELFGNYMNSEGWLRIWNSNISKTVYLLEFIFPKGDFNTVYEHYIGLKNVLLGIYGKPTEVLEDKPEEIFDTAWDLGVFTFATYYETEEGLITLEISEKQHRVEISFQDNINAEIMRKEKNNQ